MKSVLVVEDAPGLLKWLVQSIGRELPDASLEGVTNRLDAEAGMAARPPELIVLDLALPATASSDSSDPSVGLAILEAAASLPDRPRVVVLSSLDLREECLRRGADAFVSKTTRSLWPELRAQLRSRPSRIGRA